MSEKESNTIRYLDSVIVNKDQRIEELEAKIERLEANLESANSRLHQGADVHQESAQAIVWLSNTLDRLKTAADIVIENAEFDGDISAVDTIDLQLLKAALEGSDGT